MVSNAAVEPGARPGALEACAARTAVGHARSRALRADSRCEPPRAPAGRGRGRPPVSCTGMRSCPRRSRCLHPPAAAPFAAAHASAPRVRSCPRRFSRTRRTFSGTRWCCSGASTPRASPHRYAAPRAGHGGREAPARAAALRCGRGRSQAQRDRSAARSACECWCARRRGESTSRRCSLTGGWSGRYTALPDATVRLHDRPPGVCQCMR